MTIEKICLKDDDYTEHGGTLYLYEEDDGDRDVRLCWRTTTGLTTNTRQDDFVVSLKAVGKVRGEDDQETYTYSTTWDAEDCDVSHPDDYYWWNHAVDIGDFLDDCAGGTWDYADRTMDYLFLTVTMYSHFTRTKGTDDTSDDTTGTSESVTTTVKAYWLPSYELEGVRYVDSSTLRILYGTTWERTGDRALVTASSLTLDGENMVSLSAGKRYTISSIGKLDVPTSALVQHLAGEQVYVNAIQFSPSYATFVAQAPTLSGYATVTGGDGDDANSSTSSTTSSTSATNPGRPVLSIAGTGDVTSINATSSGAASITVKLVGGKYSFDEVTIEGDEGTASFPYSPLGVSNTYEAVAASSSGGVSTVARVTVDPVESSGIVLDSLQGGQRLTLDYRLATSDLGPSTTTTATHEEVKLSGRRRPCAYYGEGGTTSVSFGGALIDEDGVDFEELPEYGDLLCRFPDGRRYAIAATVKANRTTSRVVQIDVSGSEVDA